MADARLALTSNVEGDFFVDSSCIDCDACRIIAPSVFAESGDQSSVAHQPGSEEELFAAQKALVSCPTSSIGDRARHDMNAALAAYPESVAGEVYFCGFAAESSFGALSWLVRTSGGNYLIDSPRFSGPLVKNIERLGGIRRMLLTHRDDVADHEKFHQRFGCERVLHRDDVSTRTSGVEFQPDGGEPVELGDGFTMLPVPGHTKGHAVYLYDERFLFTGDHMAWDPARERLYAFRGACWYSWSELVKSMQKLVGLKFEWVLPGHGRPVHLPAERMAGEVSKLAARLRA